MSQRIQQLPPLVANQIAAGEVIERPASVVKELLENSIDAGATRLDIHIEQGGMRLIRVRDNGHGIAKADLQLALSRHATSKIATTDDLAAIHSLGFRGEALASICSVAQVVLQSCCDPSTHGWQLSASGAEVDTAAITPSPHPQGTTLSVADLFFNTPVRRKFLRSERTELLHIEHIVRCIALSRFDIAVHFFHNQKPLYRWPAAVDKTHYAKRLAHIVGQPFADNAQFITAETAELQLSGWIGNPTFSRSQTDLQYFYVNGRMVRDKLIQHALRQVYDPLISQGRHPGFVLYLELDPSLIDVNVHPTKHEIRFHQSRIVHDFILSQLKQVLQHPTSPPLPTPAAQTPPSLARRELKEPRTVVPNITPHAQALCTLYDDYLLAKVQDEIILLNRKHITSLFLQDYFQKTTRPIPSKPLLWPVTQACTAAESMQLQKCIVPLTDLGFDVALLGPTEIVLRAVPAVLGELPPLTLLQTVLACANTINKLVAHLPLPVFHSLPEWQQWLDNMLPWLEQDPAAKARCLQALNKEKLVQLFV